MDKVIIKTTYSCTLYVISVQQMTINKVPFHYIKKGANWFNDL